jgi:hypothetical protein
MSNPDGFKNLKEISLSERSSLEGKNLKAPSVIRNNSTGDVIITGYVPLVLLEQSGLGTLKIDWVNSDVLDVQVKAGSASLAGVANTMRYTGSGTGVLGAEHLRVKNIWANATGSAVAYLMPLLESHAIASMQSQLVLMNQSPYFSTLSDGTGEITYNNFYALKPGL